MGILRQIGGSGEPGPRSVAGAVRAVGVYAVCVPGGSGRCGAGATGSRGTAGANPLGSPSAAPAAHLRDTHHDWRAAPGGACRPADRDVGQCVGCPGTARHGRADLRHRAPVHPWGARTRPLLRRPPLRHAHHAAVLPAVAAAALRPGHAGRGHRHALARASPPRPIRRGIGRAAGRTGRRAAHPGHRIALGRGGRLRHPCRPLAPGEWISVASAWSTTRRDAVRLVRPAAVRGLAGSPDYGDQPAAHGPA